MITFPGKKRRLFPGVLLPLFLLCACGYTFSGSQPFPGNVKEIFVSQIQDKVGELGLAPRMRDDLIYTLTRSRQVKAANNMESADSFLETEIRNVSEESLTRTSRDEDVERRLHITAFFVLKAEDDTILWQESISEKEDFTVSSDKAVTENYRRVARDTLSQRLAERVVEHMGSTF